MMKEIFPNKRKREYILVSDAIITTLQQFNEKHQIESYYIPPFKKH